MSRNGGALDFVAGGVGAVGGGAERRRERGDAEDAAVGH